MKKNIKLIVSLIISLLIIIGVNYKSLAKKNIDEICTVEVRVKYGQTEARQMLDMINEFRTGNEAWILNSDNETKTTYTDLKELKYDYKLEEFAMQRAAEIALNFSHTRTDGTLCFTVINDRNGEMAENIAVGPTTANGVFTNWKEENEQYEQQGHRRNMLSPSYTAIGIGHVTYEGYDFWVQEFNSISKDLPEEEAKDSIVNVPIDVSYSMITGHVISVPNQVSVSYGKKVDLPTISTMRLFFKDSYTSECAVIMPISWKIEDETYARIVDNKIEGTLVGETKIETEIMWENQDIPLVVKPISLSFADIEIETDEYQYDGTQKCPKFTLTYNGKILQENVDYTLVEYRDNIEVGEARIILKGLGNFNDSKRGFFRIICSHKYTTATTKAELTKNGSIVEKCSICGNTKSTKTIAYPKTIKLKTTSYTYDGKYKKPEVIVIDSDGKVIEASNYNVTYKNNKKVGTATAVITFKGNYQGTKNLTFKINPKGVSLKKLTKGSKKFKATWSKNTTETTGYEIQYSTNKNFKSGNKTVNIKKNKTTSTTVKKLKKKKKYYVRIRTYKKINGKIYYSSWSKAKNVTTKK